MKTKFNKLAFAGFGGLLYMGLLVSCANEDLESNEVIVSEEEIVVADSDNLTLVTCSPVKKTWKQFGGSGKDHNVGVNRKIDDRSCTYNYRQTKAGSPFDWGDYRLNSTDGVSGTERQTRIERESKTVTNAKSGNYVRITGYCRILSAGTFEDKFDPDDMRDKDGTYFIQVKGKHKGGNGSSHRAIALFLAKPVRNSKGKVIKDSKGNIKSFNIYREEIKERGGRNTTGRQLVYITNVKYNKDFFVDVSSGFDKVNGKLRHYVKSKINGVNKTFAVPEPDKGTAVKLRMGAYRCHGGTARIMWRKGTKQANFVNKK